MEFWKLFGCDYASRIFTLHCGHGAAPEAFLRLSDLHGSPWSALTNKQNRRCYAEALHVHRG